MQQRNNLEIINVLEIAVIYLYSLQEGIDKKNAIFYANLEVPVSSGKQIL